MLGLDKRYGNQIKMCLKLDLTTVFLVFLFAATHVEKESSTFKFFSILYKLLLFFKMFLLFCYEINFYLFVFFVAATIIAIKDVLSYSLTLPFCISPVHQSWLL